MDKSKDKAKELLIELVCRSTELTEEEKIKHLSAIEIVFSNENVVN